MLSRRFYQLIAVLSLLCLAVPATAVGNFWVKKTYEKWSADETRSMLEESPWATSLTLGGVQTPVMGGDARNNRGYRGEMEPDQSITYVIQFRSAPPIREAQVRSSQLSSHYDKMSPEQKMAFDASAGKFLAVTFPDRVIVSVTFHTNIQSYETSLREYWTDQSLAKLSMSVYLNAGAERLSLKSYSFKEDTFQFTFPRPKQLRPDDRIGVEFVHPRINVIGQQRILQQFSLKKMMVNGEPVF